MDDMPKRLSQDGKVLSFTMRDLSADRLEWCLDTINEFNPTWMCLPPSVALMMAESRGKGAVASARAALYRTVW